ncbi:MAG: aminotransferase class V-fold PLP-dependent enzyme [Oscillospiraceae bacterium]|nr:aminotransferase class V-fold PLP-dependent enzyme [Oscillospiraceae bacterium]
MIYLDNGATSFRKPPGVYRAVMDAMRSCASPGRGGYPAAMAAADRVYSCREAAGELFDCAPEQVVLTTSCTHGLNIAIRSLVKPGGKVVISGFEHNAVTRPLHALGAKISVAGRKLFDWEDTLTEFEAALRRGVDVAVFTHVSNVFGYILPVHRMAALCREYEVPFVMDAAQSAGILPVSLKQIGADYIAMPGHKGLLGPQGTGLLLCSGTAQPLLFGGTGGNSIPQEMPEFLPDRLEPGTLNVPGYAGLREGLRYVNRVGVNTIRHREHTCLKTCIAGLKELGMEVFSGAHQASSVSFRPGMDCEEAAHILAQQGIAVRAGLHCAPLAHESAGTLETGTVRVSFGYDASDAEIAAFLRAASKLSPFRK